MIEQQGEVIAADGEQVTVRMGGRSGCPACDEGRGCGAGVFGRLLMRRPVLLSLDNPVGASAGQAVVVGLPEAWFLGLVARFYLYPLLAGLVGGAFGHYVCRMLESGAAVTDLVTLLSALAAGTTVVRRNRRWSAKQPGSVEVRLLRVVSDKESIDDKEVVT
jgi:sigma-E factor negative regulatory protein RseC